MVHGEHKRLLGRKMNIKIFIREKNITNIRLCIIHFSLCSRTGGLSKYDIFVLTIKTVFLFNMAHLNQNRTCDGISLWWTKTIAFSFFNMTLSPSSGWKCIFPFFTVRCKCISFDILVNRKIVLKIIAERIPLRYI